MTEILIPDSTGDDFHNCVSEGAEIRRLKDMIVKVSNKHSGEYDFQIFFYTFQSKQVDVFWKEKILTNKHTGLVLIG